jgi:hypothetical protein
MSLRSTVYSVVPASLQNLAKLGYYRLTSRRSDDELHASFVDDCFGSRAEYAGYVDEFEQGRVAEIRNRGLREYRRLTGNDHLFDVGLETAREYYALARKRQPRTVVETGVCNGVSTLAILLALDENGTGQLYSIDYPFRASESLEEFRAETYEQFGGAVIPHDKDPGWIIPDELRARWDLTLGKSQRALPRLVTTLDSIELFVHDSEHSHPCMTFEFELAHEWVDDGGLVLADDIDWNDAFSQFVDIRNSEWGKISNRVGYFHVD